MLTLPAEFMDVTESCPTALRTDIVLLPSITDSEVVTITFPAVLCMGMGTRSSPARWSATCPR